MSGSYDLIVVGGGAAGLAAAINAARNGATVALCDRMSRLGKKILVTGGGRCNLTNNKLSPEFFTSTDRALVASTLEKVGTAHIQDFFHGLGLQTYSEDDGRVFPTTNQASSVLKVLELEIHRLKVAVELNFEVSTIAHRRDSFAVATTGGKMIEARSVILAAGGKAYPALGSNGSGYDLAGAFGHRVTTPVPSAVPLVVKDRLCHLLQGQKILARAAGFVGGKPSGAADGEVLFTPYGLSGTAVLDVSEGLSIALNRDGKSDALLVLDFVPFLTREALSGEIARRMKSGWADRDLAAGILSDKFEAIVPGLLPAGPCSLEEKASALASALKEERFSVQGTRGWNEAEFTSGGVDAREVDSRTFESKRRKGLYLAGEILDVQGKRGGYNLAWAWASGFISGRAAAVR